MRDEQSLLVTIGLHSCRIPSRRHNGFAQQLELAGAPAAAATTPTSSGSGDAGGITDDGGDGDALLRHDPASAFGVAGALPASPGVRLVLETRASGTPWSALLASARPDVDRWCSSLSASHRQLVPRAREWLRDLAGFEVRRALLLQDGWLLSMAKRQC